MNKILLYGSLGTVAFAFTFIIVYRLCKSFFWYIKGS